MKRSPMPPRRKPLPCGQFLPAPVAAGGTVRYSTFSPRTHGIGRTPLSVAGSGGAQTRPQRSPVSPVSKKRARENRQRRAMVAELYPERPCCAVPDCGQLADDLHEPLTRARGGSITDPHNQVPLCRPHHDEVTFRPESELQWAYDLGILRHSWDRPAGDAA